MAFWPILCRVCAGEAVFFFLYIFFFKAICRRDIDIDSCERVMSPGISVIEALAGLPVTWFSLTYR